MPRIVIQNLGNLSIDSAHADRKVIELIHENGTDWMHACGKKGRCTTCKMIVLQGMENLSPETGPELAYRQQGRLRTDERLSCQSVLLQGELLIRVAKINQFPHIAYTE
ncbi:(2Fe-2S)-binding protein [Algoriphagus sp. H41]|uniref:(2Fe-2S)-binding protein n=1 Tax=Algoriphagus oliviformis TaxID=2811231 RepID=A0ABS3BXC6_9BACT|nr:2Fe-2S iron-sulfur cluster-binding protein [Algoriphagus oliviformis]MBN7809513.1 (2Fe-2S)-binding protein [Algoriphagus oliviformis]